MNLSPSRISSCRTVVLFNFFQTQSFNLYDQTTAIHIRKMKLCVSKAQVTRINASIGQASPYPRHQKINSFRLLHIREWNAALHLPPLLHTAAATHRRTMHRFEDRMTSHRRLLPVIHGFGRAKLLAHEVYSMPTDRLKAYPFNVSKIILCQHEAATKRASRKLRKSLVLGHSLSISASSDNFGPLLRGPNSLVRRKAWRASQAARLCPYSPGACDEPPRQWQPAHGRQRLCLRVWPPRP